VLGFVQVCRYGRQVARTPITEPPLFILGFYRSGTTMLHNLLSLDPRHTFPNTYECFLSNHFLITEDFVTRRFPLNATRVMDNVPMTWDQPQEDEFALGMLGQPSFPVCIAFPNDPPQDIEYLALENVPPRARECWKRTLYRFLQAVSFKRPGRLVVKSPTHTARIKILLELFPQARFVHIVRNPYRVYASTIKMLKEMYGSFGLQRPTFAGLEEFVLHIYALMMRKLEEDRPLVPPGRFYQLHYEKLVRDPVGELRSMYDALDLDSFAGFLPRLEGHLAKQAQYKPNAYDPATAHHGEVALRWKEFFHRYGYPVES
jgi:hypothetical protein